MTQALHMTKMQERRSYRNAVQASLETFYGKSKPEATKLVRGWWTRLSSTKAFESGIFLHAEPINTAGNIADVRVVAITGDNRAEYHRILDESRNLVLSKAAPSTAQVKKMQMGKPKQSFHIASSSTHGSKVVARPSENHEEKISSKQQVAYS